MTQDFDKVTHSVAAKDIREKMFVGYLNVPKNGKANIIVLALIVALAVAGLYYVSSR